MLENASTLLMSTKADVDNNKPKRVIIYFLPSSDAVSSTTMSMWGEIAEDSTPVTLTHVATGGRDPDLQSTSSTNDETGNRDDCGLVENGHDEVDPVEKMLDCLARSKEDPHFCSQQRGDPDLTLQQKKAAAKEVLDRSKPVFLARFGRFLPVDHLDYFDSYAHGNYEVDFHLKTLRRDGCAANRRARTKNRRYAAMRKMVESGDDYFSENSMRRRDPLLYERMVGLHLTEEEREEKRAGEEKREGVGAANCSLSNIIMEHLDLDRERSLKKAQRDEEKVEEFDDEAVEENATSGDDNGDGEKETDPEAKARLAEEFRQAMYQSFVEGRDVGFDYALVDGDDAYDDLAAMDRDAEDRYFDED